MTEGVTGNLATFSRVFSFPDDGAFYVMRASAEKVVLEEFIVFVTFPLCVALVSYGRNAIGTS
jgi:hypothetical protein